MTPLRIMTANLLVDRADPRALDDALLELDPDILGVQELGSRCAEVVAARFPHASLDPRADGFGLGVAAKREIATSRLDLPQRQAWVGRLDPESWPEVPGALDVLVVHLPNPIDRPWRRTRDERRESIAGIARHVEGSEAPTVVIGDMNSTPLWPEYRLLAQLGVDAASATGTARRTWSHFLHGPRLLRIDHAFVAGIRPVSTHTRRIRGTDHTALVVDLDVSA